MIFFPKNPAFQICFANSVNLPDAAAAAAKLLQSCPTLCDPIDGSPPGSPIPGILQARILEWVAISSSNAWKWKVKMKLLSCVQLFATPWTAAHQAPPSMGFSRQNYWRNLPDKYIQNVKHYGNLNYLRIIVSATCFKHETISILNKTVIIVKSFTISWWE